MLDDVDAAHDEDEATGRKAKSRPFTDCSA